VTWVLGHKIADLNKKIANFKKYDIDDKKIDALKLKKLKYESQLEEIQLS
jgi:hypothetical protein